MLPDIFSHRGRAMSPWGRNNLFDEMERTMNRALVSFLGEDSRNATTDRMTFMPHLSLSESENEIKISAELPGMSEKDITLELEHDTLTLKGEKRAEKEDKEKGRYVSERRYGSFYRTIPLSAAVDRDSVSAKFNNGVLTITLPKSATAKSDVKHIEIKHS